MFAKAIQIEKLSGFFELKLSKKSCLPYNALAIHQEESLLAISSDVGLYHKISDFPMFKGSKMRFNKPKPFDAFFMKNCNAFVAICFYIPRKPKKIFLISIQNFIKAREEDTRKSITKEHAENIADFIVDL